MRRNMRIARAVLIQQLFRAEFFVGISHAFWHWCTENSPGCCHRVEVGMFHALPEIKAQSKACRRLAI
jgi:hypothetical protein